MKHEKSRKQRKKLFSEGSSYAEFLSMLKVAGERQMKRRKGFGIRNLRTEAEAVMMKMALQGKEVTHLGSKFKAVGFLFKMSFLVCIVGARSASAP